MEVEGFRGDEPTGFVSQVSSRGEARVRILLERLIARHLTDEEIVDATFGSRNDFEIRKDPGSRRPTLMTTGTDFHYAASIERH